MKQQKKPKAPSGYVRKIQKQEKLKPIAVEKTKKPEAPKIPPGVKEILTTMSQLNIEISKITKEPYTVSIDLENGEWVLIVRGWEPYFDYYSGYKVKHIKSSLVKNPLIKAKGK